MKVKDLLKVLDEHQTVCITDASMYEDVMHSDFGICSELEVYSSRLQFDVAKVYVSPFHNDTITIIHNNVIAL